MPTLMVRIPPSLLIRWTPELAKTAIGKPCLARPIDGDVIGTVRNAYVDDGWLVLEIDVNEGSLDVNLYPKPEIRGYSMFPQPRLL